MNSDDLVWIWLQFLGIKDPVPGKVPDPTGSGFTTLHPIGTGLFCYNNVYVYLS